MSSPSAPAPSSAESRRLAPYVLSLLSRRWYEDALDALPSRRFSPGDGSLAETVFRRMWEDEARGRAVGLSEEEENGRKGSEGKRRRRMAPWEPEDVEGKCIHPTSIDGCAISLAASSTPPPDAAKIAGASLLAAARKERGASSPPCSSAAGVRRALRFTPHASRSRPASHPSPSSATVASTASVDSSSSLPSSLSPDDTLRSLPLFLSLASTGPSTSLPPSHYRRMRSLYRRLCDVYGIEARCVIFHARFLRCGGIGGATGGSVSGGDSAESMGEDADVAVRSVVLALSKAAARKGDVDALDALLGPSAVARRASPLGDAKDGGVKGGNGSDHDGDGDSRWLPLPDRLAVLNELPASTDPGAYAHLLPSTPSSSAIVRNEAHRSVFMPPTTKEAQLVESWYELRTMEVVRCTGNVQLALELCHAGLERTGNGDQSGLRRIRDEWVKRLAESEGGGWAKSEVSNDQAMTGKSAAGSCRSMTFLSPDAAPAVASPSLAELHMNPSVLPSSSTSATSEGSSSWLPPPISPTQSTHFARTDEPPAGAMSSTPSHAANTGDPLSHLQNQLTAERQRSAELRRRVHDLTETVHGLEEETCLAQEELGRARDELNSPGGPRTPQPHSHKENGSGAVSPYLHDEEDGDGDGEEEEEEEPVQHAPEGFERTIRALEGALRLETTKRAEAERALEEMRTKNRPGRTVAQNGSGPGLGSGSAGAAQCNGRSVCLDETTLRDLSTQAADILRRLTHSSTLSSEMHDFHELLTSFVDDHASENDPDGNDLDLEGEGEAEEATMAVKDVLWFMGELVWRFESIRGRYGTEGEGVREFLANVARALEGAAHHDGALPSEALMPQRTTAMGTTVPAESEKGADDAGRADEDRQKRDVENGALRSKVEELEAEIRKLKKEAADIVSAGRTLAAAAEDVMATTTPSSFSPVAQDSQYPQQPKSVPPGGGPAALSSPTKGSSADAQRKVSSAAPSLSSISPAAERASISDLATRLSTLQSSHKLSERKHLESIASLKRELTSKSLEIASLESKLNELIVAAETAEEDRRKALDVAENAKRSAELGREGDKARIRYLESALRDYGGRSPASVPPTRAGSPRSSPRPPPNPNPTPPPPPSPLMLGSVAGISSPRALVGTNKSAPSPRRAGKPPPPQPRPPPPRPPPPPPRPSAPPAEEMKEASQGANDKRLQEEVTRLAAALESSEGHRAALLEAVRQERSENAVRFGHMREMLKSLGGSGEGGERPMAMGATREDRYLQTDSDECLSVLRAKGRQKDPLTRQVCSRR